VTDPRPGGAPDAPLPAAGGIRIGARRGLAKAITLVESTRPDHRAEARKLLDDALPRSGGAIRVGISGAPGVGKSTLIEALGLRIVAGGSSLAVLPVDPSSRRTGGSILGDKTRMSELARHPAAYIRPSPSKGDLGGVARRTAEVLVLCEAAGYEVVLIETVGIGQSEVAVADIVDTFVLLVSGGAGDELQGVKRGVMELADVVAVSKADGELAAAAHRAAADYRHALRLLPRRHPAWEPKVVETSAVTGAGLDELWDAVLAHRATLEADGSLAALRREQAVARFRKELADRAVEALPVDLGAVEARVAAGELDPSAAVDEVLAGGLG
jgi:LAO/AO transport system kinase